MSSAKSNTSSPKPRATGVSAQKSNTSSPMPKSALSERNRNASRSPKSQASMRSGQTKRSPSPNKALKKSSNLTDESGENVVKEENEKVPEENPTEGEHLNTQTIQEEPSQPVEEPLSNYVKSLVQLASLHQDLWNEFHEQTIKEFLTQSSKKVLCVYIEPKEEEEDANKLIVQLEMPHLPIDQFYYFVKAYYSNEIDSKETFQKNVQYGLFTGKHLLSLLRLTSGLYAPLFFGNKTWPDSKTCFFRKNARYFFL
jgi:hypothetical protein